MSQPVSWNEFRLRQALRMAVISGGAVGSLVAVTRFVPAPRMVEPRTTRAAKGPPCPLRTLSIAKRIALAMNGLSIGVLSYCKRGGRFESAADCNLPTTI